MPLRTYADEKNIYSVDMMLAYLNTHKYPVVELPMTDFEWQLEQDVWGDWAPEDVLKKPKAKKYAENSERIKKADLSYPVIVTAQGHKLVDGYHRVAKAYSQGKKTGAFIGIRADESLHRYRAIVSRKDGLMLDNQKWTTKVSGEALS